MTISALNSSLEAFASFALRLGGDEKGEAQIFCDRLFQAFGHEGLIEAGATLEYRLKKDGGGTSFADLMWKPRCLIEMKKSGTDLRKHFRQALDYWIRAVPDRPRYVVLCNFEEFQIYDFEKQVEEPVDTVKLSELPVRYIALSFLLPEPTPPVFKNDLEAVSRSAAKNLGELSLRLVGRGVAREEAQRFVLQCVLAMFAEDVNLLPAGIFSRIVNEAETPENAFDDLFSLFTHMNSPGVVRAGKFKGVRHFNGGLFSAVPEILLEEDELRLLKESARQNWALVRPEIFGTLFEGSMDEGRRHAEGAHFTNQADIMRIVQPTIVDPWRDRISRASNLKDIQTVLNDMATYRVLDPACGSGNFLYVAFREMRRLEVEAISKERSMRRSGTTSQQGSLSYISTENFLGIDTNRFAVEVAKATLMIAEKLSTDELDDSRDVLPLRNLDRSIVCADALFAKWPPADVIIGNPPYIGRRKMVKELGVAYASSLTDVHPAVSGVSDFVTYWFPLAHDHLKVGGRAGFVATQAIRANNSRESSLDYIVDNGGVIFEAVDSQPWSGTASVHVSIVNWTKGEHDGDVVLWENDGQLRTVTSFISSSLKATLDVRKAPTLKANTVNKMMFQGQTPGHSGFIIDQEAADYFRQHGESEVIHPWIAGGADLISDRTPTFVIDIAESDLGVASAKYPQALKHLARHVREDRLQKAREQEEANAEAVQGNPKARPATHHINVARRWWQLFYRRGDLLGKIGNSDAYLAIPRVATPDRRIIVVRVPSDVRPGDLLAVTPLDDLYSMGVISSGVHQAWLEERCSKLGIALRYTSKSVWDTFPWPQAPTPDEVSAIEGAMKEVLEQREILRANGATLEMMYNAIREPGQSRLRDAHEDLDRTVVKAYHFDGSGDWVAELFALNSTIASSPFTGVGPGVVSEMRSAAGASKTP